ncbi:MAG: hypothetical protein QM426_06215 [Euryarchaeota archaeon]|nr:hypothetical protein [Euryarchaeota archaeon]
MLIFPKRNVVHCVGGVGRTGIVLGYVLRDLGFCADDVISCLDRINSSGA